MCGYFGGDEFSDSAPWAASFEPIWELAAQVIWATKDGESFERVYISIEIAESLNCALLRAGAKLATLFVADRLCVRPVLFSRFSSPWLSLFSAAEFSAPSARERSEQTDHFVRAPRRDGKKLSLYGWTISWGRNMFPGESAAGLGLRAYRQQMPMRVWRGVGGGSFVFHPCAAQAELGWGTRLDAEVDEKNSAAVKGADFACAFFLRYAFRCSHSRRGAAVR
jgi:hypothetical protein